MGTSLNNCDHRNEDLWETSVYQCCTRRPLVCRWLGPDQWDSTTPGGTSLAALSPTAQPEPRCSHTDQDEVTTSDHLDSTVASHSISSSASPCSYTSQPNEPTGDKSSLWERMRSFCVPTRTSCPCFSMLTGNCESNCDIKHSSWICFGEDCSQQAG